MADQIREYVIKIRAEVKEALAQIDQLKGKFDKVELKTEVDKSFQSSIEKLSGSIGKITQEMGDLKSSFKDVDFKSFTGDMKKSFDDLKVSIDDIKNSAKTLSDAFDFSGKSNNGFQNFINDLNKQITDLAQKYQDSVQQISDMTAQGFVPKGSPASGVNNVSSAITQQQSGLKDALKRLQGNVQDSKELESLSKEAVEIINRIKRNIEEANVTKVADLYEEGSLASPSQYTAVEGDLENLKKVLSKMQEDSTEVDEALAKIGITSAKSIPRIQKTLQRAIQVASDEYFKDEEVARKQKRSPAMQAEEMRVVLNYDITANDDPEEIRAKANEIVNKIKTEIQTIVQEEVGKDPIRIPITFGVYEEAQDNKESATALTDKLQDESLIKNLQVAIRATTEGLVSDINTKIKEINSQIGTTIDVPIRPILPKKTDIASKVGELEAEASEQIEQGIQVNLKQLPSMSMGDDNCCEQVVSVLNDIRGIVSEISGKLNNLNLKVELPRGGAIGSGVGANPLSNLPSSQVTKPSTTAIPSTTSQIPQAQQKPQISTSKPQQPQKIVVQTKTANITNERGGVIQTDIDNATVSGAKDSDIFSETGAFGNTGQPGYYKRRENKFLTKQFPYILMRGRRLTGITQGYTAGNARHEIDMSTQKRYYAGMDQLQKDIAKRLPAEKMHQQFYYTGSHQIKGNPKLYAHYGQPGMGESLQEFQDRVDKIFEIGTQAITKFADSLHKQMQQERTDKTLVNSGVDNYKVAPWMKRIIDRDYYQETIDLQDKNLKKRIQKEKEEGNKNFVADQRKEFVRDAKNELELMEAKREELVDAGIQYQEAQRQQEAISQVASKALPAIKKIESEEELQNWYKGLDKNSLLRSIIPKELIEQGTDSNVVQNALQTSEEKEIISQYTDAVAGIKEFMQLTGEAALDPNEKSKYQENMTRAVDARNWLLENGYDFDDSGTPIRTNSGDSFKKLKEMAINYVSDALDVANVEVLELEAKYEERNNQLDELDNRIQNQKHRLGQIKNAKDEDVAAEVVRREHREKRRLLATDKGGLTEDREEELKSIENKTVESFAENVSKALIRGHKATSRNAEINDTTQVLLDLLQGTKKSVPQIRDEIQGILNDVSDVEEQKKKVSELLNINKNNDLLETLYTDLSDEKKAESIVEEFIGNYGIANYLKDFTKDEEYKPFGANALKKPNEKVISRAEVVNPATIKFLDKMEKAGYAQDELTGNWIAIKGKNRTATTNPEAAEDVFATINDLAKEGQERYNRQRAITDMLAANEENFKNYISSFESSVQTGEIDAAEVKNMADFAYAMIPEDLKDEFVYLKKQMSDKVSAVRATLKDKGEGRDDRSFLSQQETEIWDFATQLENGLYDYSPKEIYDFAQSWIIALKESRAAENEILRNTQETMQGVVEATMKEPVSTDTYIKNKGRLLRKGNEIASYDRLMAKNSGGKTVVKKDGSTKEVFTSVDYDSVPQYIKEKRDQALKEYKEIRDQQIGYEISHAIRDYKGKLIEPESLDDLYSSKSRVINLGLSPDMQNKYALLPNPVKISEPLRDEHGHQMRDEVSGQLLREAVGYSSEEVTQFANILRATNQAIDGELAKLPQTEGELNARIQEQIQEVIDGISTDRNKMVSELHTRFQDYRQEHADQFSSGSAEAEQIAIAKFKSSNRESIRKIRLANEAITQLKNDEPIGDLAKLRNNQNMQQILTQQILDEVLDPVLSYLGGDKDQLAQEISNKLREAQNLRMSEKEAKTDFDNYISRNMSFETMFSSDRPLRSLYQAYNQELAKNEEQRDEERLSNLKELIATRKDSLVKSQSNIQDQELLRLMDYVDGITEDRRKAEQEIIKSLPLDKLFQMRTGELGQSEFTTEAGSAVDNLFSMLEQLDSLRGESRILEQTLQQNKEISTARSTMAKTFADEIESERKELISIQKNNEIEAQKFDQLAQNDVLVQERNKRIAEKAKSEEVAIERKKVRRKEIEEESNLPTDQLIQKIENERDTATKELQSQVDSMNKSVEDEKSRIIETSKQLNANLETEVKQKEETVKLAAQRVDQAKAANKTSSEAELQAIKDRETEYKAAQDELMAVKRNASVYKRAAEIIQTDDKEEARLSEAIQNARGDRLEEALNEWSQYSLKKYNNPVLKDFLDQSLNLKKLEADLSRQNASYQQRIGLARNIGKSKDKEAATRQYQQLMFEREGLSEIDAKQQSEEEEIWKAKHRHAIAAGKQALTAENRARLEQKQAEEEKRRKEYEDKEREILASERAGYYQEEEKRQEKINDKKEKEQGKKTSQQPQIVSKPQTKQEEIITEENLPYYISEEVDYSGYDQMIASEGALIQEKQESAKASELASQATQSEVQASNELRDAAEGATPSVEGLANAIGELGTAAPGSAVQKATENQKQLASQFHTAVTEAVKVAGITAGDKKEQFSSIYQKYLSQAINNADSIENLTNQFIAEVKNLNKVIPIEKGKTTQQQSKKEKAVASPQRLDIKPVNENAITFNGKQYMPLSAEQGKANLDAMWKAPELQGLMNAKGNRYNKKAISGLKNILKGYALTGDTEILKGIEATFKGGKKGTRGFAANLSNELIKDGVRKFVKKEIARQSIPYSAGSSTALPQPTITKNDVAVVEDMANAQGKATQATEEQIQKTEQLKALLKDLNAGEFREQVGNKYKSVLGELIKEGSTLTPEDAANQVRAYLGELRSSSKSSKGSTSAFLEENGIKQIPGLTSEQQAEYEDWVSEILARGAEDVRVSAMTWEDVQKELDELEAEYIAIGQASTGSTDKVATGIDQIEQEAKEATPTVINLKNALESIGQIYSSSGREGLLSSLTALSAKDMRKIAEDNGYVNAKGKLPKSLNKTQLAGLIADNYENSLQKSIPEIKVEQLTADTLKGFSLDQLAKAYADTVVQNNDLWAKVNAGQKEFQDMAERTGFNWTAIEDEFIQRGYLAANGLVQTIDDNFDLQTVYDAVNKPNDLSGFAMQTTQLEQTETQAKETEQAVISEGQATGTADTSGTQQQIDKMHELTAVASEARSEVTSVGSATGDQSGASSGGSSGNKVLDMVEYLRKNGKSLHNRWMNDSERKAPYLDLSGWNKTELAALTQYTLSSDFENDFPAPMSGGMGGMINHAIDNSSIITSAELLSQQNENALDARNSLIQQYQDFYIKLQDILSRWRTANEKRDDLHSDFDFDKDFGPITDDITKLLGLNPEKLKETFGNKNPIINTVRYFKDLLTTGSYTDLSGFDKNGDIPRLPGVSIYQPNNAINALIDRIGLSGTKTWQRMAELSANKSPISSGTTTPPFLDSELVKTEAQDIIAQCDAVIAKADELKAAGITGTASAKSSARSIKKILSADGFDPNNISEEDLVGLTDGMWTFSHSSRQNKDTAELSKDIQQYVQNLLDKNGIKTEDWTGQPYDIGLSVQLVNDESTNKDNAIIKEMTKPVIEDKDGRVIRFGSVIVGDSPNQTPVLTETATAPIEEKAEKIQETGQVAQQAADQVVAAEQKEQAAIEETKQKIEEKAQAEEKASRPKKYRDVNLQTLSDADIRKQIGITKRAKSDEHKAYQQELEAEQARRLERYTPQDLSKLTTSDQLIAEYEKINGIIDDISARTGELNAETMTYKQNLTSALMGVETKLSEEFNLFHTPSGFADMTPKQPEKATLPSDIGETTQKMQEMANTASETSAATDQIASGMENAKNAADATVDSMKRVKEEATSTGGALMDYYTKYHPEWDDQKKQIEYTKVTQGAIDSLTAGGKPGFKFTGSDQQLEYIQALNAELEQLGYQMQKVGSGENTYWKWAQIPSTSSVDTASADAAKQEAEAKREAAQASQEKAAAEQADAKATSDSAQASQNAAQGAKTEVKVSTKPEEKKPSKIDEIISNYNTTAQNIGASTIQGEATDFGALVTMLTQTIPQAIDVKNQAFMQEAQLVQQLATEEANAFNSLVAQLEKIAGLATNFKFDFSIRGGDQFTDDFLTNFSKLKSEIESVDPAKFESIGATFSSIGSGITGNADLAKTFSELGDAVKAFAKNIDSTELYGNFDKVAGMVERIATSGAQLKNMAAILKNQKLGKYTQDAQLDSYMVDFKKNLDYLNSPNRMAKYAQLSLKQETANEILSSGGQLNQSTMLTADETAFLSDYNSRLDMLYSLKGAIGDVRNELLGLGKDSLVPKEALNELGKQFFNFENTMKDVQYQAKEYSNAPKDYTKQLDAVSKKMNQISEDERKQFSTAFGTLNSKFEQGVQGLKTNTMTAEQFTVAMDEAFKAYNRFKKVAPDGKMLMSGVGGGSDDARSQISAYLKQNYKLVTQDVSGGQINKEGIASFNAQVVDANNNVRDLKINWDSWTGQVGATASTAADQFKGRFMSLFTDLQAKSKQLFIYWTATFLNPYRLIGTFKQVINIVKELDTAMMELRKVSSETSDSYKDFQTKSFSMADEVGGTAKDIIQATTSWKKLGKSFEESQEAAQASVKMLNVSEFTNIDDATTALVSMKQAFKDSSYDDFIDKLNAVGDSYSSATDQLAEGMKNVSAVMKVQGNDIDQTLALLTAANDVTQDISKASMGIRTVALRMAGTQDAKQQLEDLGEDTSDFVVQTTSKVDAKVRKYTATKENPQGISVLDESGRLRDTYDVLLDISRVWDEIIAKDEQFGTNTSNALLELLAGKTRSNVLASILQSPELLEQAYETSKNAKGTGQKELDIYLDSVQAKTTQISNNLQELAAATIDTEGFKTLLDLINGLLKGVNALAEAFGGLNLAIGAIAGFQLQKHGLGKHLVVSPESQPG